MTKNTLCHILFAALTALLLCPCTNVEAAPGAPRRSAGAKNVFVFDMGTTYGNFKKTLTDGKIEQERDGQSIRFRKSGLEYLFSFYQKQRIENIELEKIVRDDKEKMVLSKLILQPAHPPARALLYAVTIRFPMIPFRGEKKKRIMEGLNLAYGKAVNLNKTYFDMENQTTLVRVYLENFRKRRYLVRMTFVSRALSRARNEHIKNLRKLADSDIKTRLKDANEKLKKEKEAEKKKAEKEKSDKANAGGPANRRRIGKKRAVRDARKYGLRSKLIIIAKERNSGINE